MDFLNVGPWELVLVLIIAILVAGPKRMVEIARQMGQFSRQLRDLSREFTTALQAEIQATEDEAARTELDLQEVQRDLQGVLDGSPTKGGRDGGAVSGEVGAAEAGDETAAAQPAGGEGGTGEA